MDIMRLQLQTKVLKHLVARLLQKAIFKKTGMKMDIQINELELDLQGDDLSFHVDVNGRGKLDKRLHMKLSQLIDR